MKDGARFMSRLCVSMCTHAEKKGQGTVFIGSLPL